jgi:ABC-type antimicrobial peptide transport system permease subunit
MLKHYLTIIWRNFVKDRQFSLLNLVGLSTGLACALLIYLWINDELKVDKFNEKDDRLFQVIKTSPNADGTIDTHETTPGLLAELMAKEIPEVEYAVSVIHEEMKGIVSTNDKHIKATPQFVGKDFFNIFSLRLIHGNKDKVLANKHGIILSDKLAKKLFNTTQDVVGKTVTWDLGNELNGQYVVSGIFESPPSNASLQSDLIFPYSHYFDTYKDQYGLTRWNSNSPSTYLVLKKGVNPNDFNKKIRDYTKAKFKAAHGTAGLKWEGIIFLQRYSDKYLYNRYENGKVAGGRIEYVRLFFIIGIFILVIACINFMNLATAKATRRIKEVGIKKVVGAHRSALVLQYMAESMLMAFLSLSIAIALVSFFLPQFSQVTGKELSLNFNTDLVLAAIGITFVTGLIAGSYPALYLSGFRPAAVLKGKLTTSVGESLMRKGLVIFQFTISVILIVSVLVVYKQTKYIQSKNLGYSKDNIIQFASEGKLRKGLSSFLAEVKKIPGVVNASSMDGDMVGGHGGGGGINWPGKLPGQGIEFSGLDVDYDLIETFGMVMAEGRPFSREFGSDSSSVIFNEAAIAAMGLKNPIGQTVDVFGRKKRIVGVVKNFHFESLYKKLGPFFFRYGVDNSNVLIKIKSGTERETLVRLERFYKNYNMGLPFEYRFIDEDFQKLYAAEQRVAVLSRYFAGIAVVISCLGLFGLAAFTAQRRQKEIGIRKIVGATVSNVIVLLSKDFLRLIMIAVLIAVPAAWWLMHSWLNDFEYRINIGAAVFVIASASVILITILTISFQAIKAAVANPVKSLRTE